MTPFLAPPEAGELIDSVRALLDAGDPIRHEHVSSADHQTDVTVLLQRPEVPFSRRSGTGDRPGMRSLLGERSFMRRVACLLLSGVLLALGAGPSDASTDLDVVAAYVDREPTVDRLLIVGPEGSMEQIGLPAGHSRVHGLSLRSDGDALAFSASVPGGIDGVFVLYRRSGDLRRLGDGAGEVAWAPDGRRLAYVATDGALVVQGAEEGEPAQIARGSDPAAEVDRFHGCLRWSPDGSMLLASYQSFGEGGTGPEGSLDALHIYRSDGSGLRGSVPATGCGSWSPGQDRIAYVGGDGAVRTATPDGEEAEVLVPASCGAAVAPEWGADGLLFHRWIEHSPTSEAAAGTLDPACGSDQWNGTWIRHNDGSTALVVPGAACCARWLSGDHGHFSFVTSGQADDRGNRSRRLWLQMVSGEPRRLSSDDHDVHSADVLVATSAAPAMDGATRPQETVTVETSTPQTQHGRAPAPSSPAAPATTAPPPPTPRPGVAEALPQLFAPTPEGSRDPAPPWTAAAVAGMALAGVAVAATRVRRMSEGSERTKVPLLGGSSVRPPKDASRSGFPLRRASEGERPAVSGSQQGGSGWL